VRTISGSRGGPHTTVHVEMAVDHSNASLLLDMDGEER
jgi:hypothetical protein